MSEGCAAPLILDERKAIDGPGLHALIIGVSSYDYLSGGTATLAPGATKRMRDLAAKIGQLSGPALSAKSLADWMLERREHFGAPLKTVRLLASPSLTEKGLEGIMPATVNNVVAALTDWRQDASKRNDRRDVSLL